jgi:hypothetical protein
MLPYGIDASQGVGSGAVGQLAPAVVLPAAEEVGLETAHASLPFPYL